mgnify:CR=1 FL=1
MNARKRHLHHPPVLLALLTVAALGVGCKETYQKRVGGFMASYRSGQFEQAAVLATATADAKQKDPAAILWRLEQGTALRTAGDYEASNAAFAMAEAKMDAERAKGGIAATAEVATLVVTADARPYLGTDYDRIMTNTYQALNNLELGEMDNAAAQLIRAYDRQKEAVIENAKRIEKAEKEAKDKGVDTQRASGDPKLQHQLDENFPDIDKWKVYANYVNPYAEFLQGLYFTMGGEDGSDRERGLLSFQRVAGMAPDNTQVSVDLALAEAIAQGNPPPALTYVIFETGTAPRRESVRIDLPLFVATRVDYVGVAFPKLNFNDNFASQLVVTAGGEAVPTQLLCDMDGVIYTEFKNRLPEEVTRALISAGIKSGGAYAASEATRSDAVANAAVRIGMSLYNFATNEADTRTWHTLPKQVQYARLPTPEDRTLTLTASGGATQTVTVAPGTVNVVVVRSTSATAPLKVSQFRLR